MRWFLNAILGAAFATAASAQVAPPGAPPMPSDLSKAIQPDAPAKPEAPKRLPVPDAAAIARAEKLVKEIYEKDYQIRGGAARSALAAKMLEQARQTTDDLPAQFVLMREARDVAASAGNLPLAALCVDAQAERFDVDAREQKLDLIKRLGSPAWPEAARLGATMATTIADDAAKLDDFETAMRAINLANVAAKASRDPAATKAAATRLAELRAFQASAERIAAAAETLKTTPADPSANLSVGRHLAVAKGDWDKALPHLAAGSDPALKALAAKDVARPANVEGQLDVANAWWELAERIPGADANATAARTAYKRRAAAWYAAAKPQVNGLSKLLVEKRLAEVGEEIAPITTAPPAPEQK